MNTDEQNNPNPNNEPASNPLEARFATPLDQVVQVYLDSMPKPQKREDYLGHVARILGYLVGEFGQIAIGEVTPAMLRKAAARSYRSRNEPLRVKSCFKKFFGWGRRHGYLPPGAPTAAEIAFPNDAITAKELAELLGASALAQDPQTRTMIALAAVTDLRWSQLALLRRRHIRAFGKSVPRSSGQQSAAA
ncbi:MAG TPA: hypothetical protein VFE51_10995 [Verrucomicrobiae bacterium]|nr:hypothetical protein [Verrucomicrobiae bacterium]